MICRNCIRRLAHQNVLRSAQKPDVITRRTFISTPSRFATTTINADVSETNNPRPHDHPAATSTSAAQPFTAGTAPRPRKNAAEEAVTASRVPSSAPEGTVLKGINFMKNQQDPIALADEEYPDWLWRALDKQDKEGDDLEGEGDLFSKSKKQRRRAAKALRKRQLANPDLLQAKVPLHEQSIDIYAGDGTLEGAKEAIDARQELTKAMRDARRAKIKESNYLKAMK